MGEIIDFRSDTITQPSKGMRDFMMEAKVGDDVFDEDPSIQSLQNISAELFGKEAALFCVSGTMCNQIAIKIQTQPMEEIICDKTSHIYYYEGAGPAFHSGVSLRLVDGDRGRISADQVKENINANNVHLPKTSLVSLENTSNKGGGSCYELESIESIAKVCRQNKLALHLDGARIMNALVAKNQSAKSLGIYFDTISLCLSKGLGAPVGSVLISSKENIEKAKRVRKVFGGGMRQAGFLAAAGIYALQHNVDRLAIDHDHAKKLAETLQGLSWVKEVLPVESNIVVFQITSKNSPEEIIQKLSQEQIRLVQFGPQTLRMVCHLDISGDMIDRACSILKKF